VPAGEVVYSADYKWINIAAVNVQGAVVAAETVTRYLAATLAGIKPLTMGQALAGGLRAGLLSANVPVWLSTPLVSLQHNATGRVTGVLATQGGAQLQINATRGVIVGSGGFEHNLAMRDEYEQQPIGIDWTVAAASNTGDGIEAGLSIGAALDLMDDAWWGPTQPAARRAVLLPGRAHPAGWHHGQCRRCAVRQRGRAVQRRRARHVPAQRHGAGHPRVADRGPELSRPLPVQGRPPDLAVPRFVVLQRRRVQVLDAHGPGHADRSAIGGPGRHGRPVQRLRADRQGPRLRPGQQRLRPLLNRPRRHPQLLPRRPVAAAFLRVQDRSW